mmetsp:Transcript_47696/g.94407  ORF Transcript_47696/g.94407 Transcript_47696/m.94407 type:complete len:413 (-) Transcript_47696:37-1275(-)
MCFVDRPSCKVESPVTNSSIVSSPDSSMSNMSQMFDSSWWDRWTPSSFILLCTKSSLIIESNSFRSRLLFPSMSASLKHSLRNSTNASYFRSCSFASDSLRSTVARIMLLEATAVKTERTVHAARPMKRTKNNRHQGLISTRGRAMSSQLSMVISWNKVKTDVGTSRKRSRADGDAGSPPGNRSSPSSTPRPNNRVKVMPSVSINMTTKTINHMEVMSMPRKAVMKAIRRGKSLNTRSSRKSRVSRTYARTGQRLCWDCRPPAVALLQRRPAPKSIAPQPTTKASSQIHRQSWPKQSSEAPIATNLAQSSNTKTPRHTTSAPVHRATSGSSVSPHKAAMLTAMAKPTALPKASPLTQADSPLPPVRGPNACPTAAAACKELRLARGIELPSSSTVARLWCMYRPCPGLWSGV